jgi:hypothetical protein
VWGAPNAPGDLASFLEGKWGVAHEIDDLFAKQLGLEAIDEQNEAMLISEIYTFKPDGTYTITFVENDNVFAGTWQESGDGISLAVDTLDGVPMAQKREEIKKTAESGTVSGLSQDIFFDNYEQELRDRTKLFLATDGRSLVFQDGVLGNENFENLGGVTLVRLEPPAEG